MALFASKEEKEAKKEAKRDAKVQATLEKFGVADLTGRDADDVQRIATELSSTNFIELGAMMSGSEKDFMKVQTNYLRVLMEQNFILIRQLNDVLKHVRENG